MLIYAIFDKKAMIFFPPFCCENKIQAIRGLSGTVNHSGNVIFDYPDDFALYFLGEFEPSTGNITQPEIKYIECEARQLVTSVPNGSVTSETMRNASGPAAMER